MTDDLIMGDDNELCYTETYTESHLAKGRGVHLEFECGHSAMFWIDHSLDDFIAYERITADNRCPHCGYDPHPIVYNQPPIAVAPTAPRPKGEVITLEGETGNLTVDLTTGHIDGSHDTIRECLNHLGFDDLSDITTPANQIIIKAVKSIDPQLSLF